MAGVRELMCQLFSDNIAIWWYIKILKKIWNYYIIVLYYINMVVISKLA